MERLDRREQTVGDRTGRAMQESQVQYLFRKTIADGDAEAMRTGLELMLALSSSGKLSAERGYARMGRPDSCHDARFRRR